MEWAGALRLRGVGKEGKKGCRKRPKSSAIIDAGVVNGGMINVWSEGGREGGRERLLPRWGFKGLLEPLLLLHTLFSGTLLTHDQSCSLNHLGAHCATLCIVSWRHGDGWLLARLPSINRSLAFQCGQ